MIAGIPARLGLRPARGLTVTELMVSVVILVMMIYIVNTMLTSSRQAVQQAQAMIHVNAEARAIADRIRSDVGQISPEGFLLISSRRPDISGTTSNFSYMAFMTANPIYSLCSAPYGTSAFVEYGATDAEGTMYRRAWVCRPDMAPGLGTSGPAIQYLDYERIAMEYMRSPDTPRSTVAQMIGTNFNVAYTDGYNFTSTRGLCAPPVLSSTLGTLSEVMDNWPYLMTGLQEMRIMWTGTNPGTPVQWYREGVPADPNWFNYTSVSGDPPNVYTTGPEYMTSSGATGFYSAAWTFKRKDNWPRAIRVDFRIQPPLAGVAPQSFSVIANLAN